MPIYLLQIPPEATQIVDQLAGRDIAVILGVAVVAIAIALSIFGLAQLRSAGSQNQTVQAQGSMAMSVASMASSVSEMSKSLNNKIDTDREQTEVLKAIARVQADSDTRTRMAINNLQSAVNALKDQQQSWQPFPEELLTNARELHEAATDLRRLARSSEQKAATLPQ